MSEDKQETIRALLFTIVDISYLLSNLFTLVITIINGDTLHRASLPIDKQSY